LKKIIKLEYDKKVTKKAKKKKNGLKIDRMEQSFTVARKLACPEFLDFESERESSVCWSNNKIIDVLFG